MYNLINVSAFGGSYIFVMYRLLIINILCLFFPYSVALQHCKMLLKGYLYAVCSWNISLSPKDLYRNSSIFFLDYFTYLYPKNRPMVSLFRVNEY